jgi:Gpi18-like mannosyltransferase
MVLDWLFGNWLWWDGGWYVQIAQHGYTFHPHEQSPVAFFPAYPLTVRAVSWLVPGGVNLAAIAVTMASGAIAFVLFERWCRLHLDRTETMWALAALAIYPYSWFLYGSAYADAFFLAAAIGAFLLLERNRPIAAGLVGILVTAARPTGIAVLIGLVAVMISRRPSRARDYGVLLAVLGIGGWCAYLAFRFGHPFAFVETEGSRGWDRGPGVATWLKFDFFHAVLHDPWRGWVPLAIQAAMCVAFLAAVPAVRRRFGNGYAVFVAAAVLIPAMSTDDFMGTGRYVLAAFPIFALIGSRLAHRPVGRWAYVTVSTTAMVFGATLFATGYILS